VKTSGLACIQADTGGKKAAIAMIKAIHKVLDCHGFLLSML